uniref:Uncharacterized protein n=1 Tax=Candidatus Kentrum sp. UNK TaxID=2126344 RepID=A0A451B2Y9_9GAMM|nr:MAG: hypothetical protein BECKUNK1418G_GA0071005_11251 [Candidatus Kentron sp. UNK]VFK72633.1 MAG: hypothetical protein BECKUNK1418H_GA0071006_11271 [Candidatus Kentron sp. UNK]
MVNEVDPIETTNATLVAPEQAPVSDPKPLTGREKAGVSLAWGIISVLVVFLVIILTIFVWGEHRFLIGLEQLESLKNPTPENLEKLSQLVAALESKHKSFRIFWFDILQLILLNVLFPTLTALLGYIFGASKNNSAINLE